MTEFSETGTNSPVHPGLLLDQLLKQKDIQGSTFADETGLSRSLVSQITRGNRRVTQNTAQKIVQFFAEGSVVDWLRKQQEYDLAIKTQDASEVNGTSN